jgi:hypothetical protein
MRDKRSFFNPWFILTFVFLAFICGMKFNSIFLKPTKPLETIDIGKYEADFREVHKLISQNTLAVYGIADAITNSWINSLALKEEGSKQVTKLFSDLENNGTKADIIEKNKKIEDAMIRLKDGPLKYLEAYNALEDTYTLYFEFFKLTLNPPESLIIYSKRITDLEGELANNFRRLSLYAPKAAERPRAEGTQLALADTTVPEPPIITTNRSREVSQILVKLDDIMGKSSEDVERMMGPPQSEVWAQFSGAYQKQYKYNKQKVNVYYLNDQVTGLSN